MQRNLRQQTAAEHSPQGPDLRSAEARSGSAASVAALESTRPPVARLEARLTLARQANSTTVFLFWRIGQQVNSEILHHQRAGYGQKIVTTLATQLVAGYGRSFESRNLHP